jgi:hypothetical protein
MASNMHLAPRRSHRALLAGLLVLSALAAKVGAEGGDVSLKPVFFVGAGYDSNILIEPSDPESGYFGSLGAQIPFQYKIGPHSSLSANYFVLGQWYRDLRELDNFPEQQTASLGYQYQGRAWQLGLNGSYADSLQAADVFPVSGLAQGRQRVRSGGGGLNLGRKLGQFGSLAVTYHYSRSLYSDQSTNLNEASLTLGRQFGRQTTLDVRYDIQRYAFVDDTSDTWNTITGGWTQNFSPRTVFSLRAGARILGDSTKPDVNASLSQTWRRVSLSLSYAKTYSFVPEAVRFTDVDSISLSLVYQGRALRLTLGTGYYRNRAEGQTANTYRGTFDLVYSFNRWLGIAATYFYTFQNEVETDQNDIRRQVARVNLVLSPWSPRGVATPPR